ncbi:hypothetical protein PVIIG_06487, partial [Plasmodium vivax India VII]
VKSLSLNKNNTNGANVRRVTSGIALKEELEADDKSPKGTSTFKTKGELTNGDNIRCTDVPTASKYNSTLDVYTTPLQNNTYSILSIPTKCESLCCDNVGGTRVHGGASPRGGNQSEQINTVAVEEHLCGGCIAGGESGAWQIDEGNGSEDGADVNAHACGGKLFGACVMENMERSEEGTQLLQVRSTPQMRGMRKVPKLAKPRKPRTMRSSQVCVKAENGSERDAEEEPEDGRENGRENDAESGAASSQRNSARCSEEGGTGTHTDQEISDKDGTRVNIKMNAKGHGNHGDVSGYQKKCQCTYGDGKFLQHLDEMETKLENINCMYTPAKCNYLNEAHFLNNHVNQLNLPNGAWLGRNSLSDANREAYMQQLSHSHSHMSGTGGNLNVVCKGEHTDGGSDCTQEDANYSESSHGSDSSSDSERVGYSCGDYLKGELPHSIGMPLKYANNVYVARPVSGSLYYPGLIANRNNIIYAAIPPEGGNVHATLGHTAFDCMNSALYNGSSPGLIVSTSKLKVKGRMNCVMNWVTTRVRMQMRMQVTMQMRMQMKMQMRMQ